MGWRDLPTPIHKQGGFRVSEEIKVKGNRIIIPDDLKDGVYLFPFMDKEFIVVKTKEYIEIYEAVEYEDIKRDDVNSDLALYCDELNIRAITYTSNC